MQKSDSSQAINAHRKVGASTTLDRRYVKRPSQSSPTITHFNDQPTKVVHSIKITDESDRAAEQEQENIEQAIAQESIEQAIAQESSQQEQEQQSTSEFQQVAERELAPTSSEMFHPVQAAAIHRMNFKNQPQARPTAKQIKDQEIRKALASSSRKIDKDIANRDRAKKRSKIHFGIARVMLAVSCAAVAVLAVAYFVGTNMPDLSMRVTAMQSGVNASYPGYVPRGYSLTDLSSEDGKISMHFKNDETGDRFTMTEENSSWDSNALLTNYVKPKFDDSYTIVREQGLTIYTTQNQATWVNGGVIYKLKVESGELTKKQIKSIAVSM